MRTTRISALVSLCAAFAVNAQGWSAAGTVKSTTGTALSGVVVSVKDSSRYSVTTSATGAFLVQSTAAVLGVMRRAPFL